MNREQWLTELAERFLWPLILAEKPGSKPEHWRLSIGFPRGSRGGKFRAIGQCWPSGASADKAIEMFVSPELEPFDAAHVTLHELIHAADRNKSGHKGEFKRVATAVGLTGKMTATVPGDALKVKIEGWLKKLPPFPGAVLKPNANATKPGSRLLKLQCGDCGYVLRTTAKWLLVGLPTCCCGGEFFGEDAPSEGDE